jgi:hypothetical protein
MKLLVIVDIPVGDVIDPYGAVHRMANAVGGTITHYDVSVDGITWKYSELPVVS